jgi:biotin carboxyl carrier protein
MRFQALLGDRTFDLDLDGGTVTVDGEAAEARLHRLGPHSFHLLLDARSYVFTAERADAQTVRVTFGGRTTAVRLKSERDLLLERLGIADDTAAGVSELRAPMPGLVLQVLAEPGQHVEAGAGLVVLEAMKMENELRAEAPGTVATVHVAPGGAVGKGDLLVSFEG